MIGRVWLLSVVGLVIFSQAFAVESSDPNEVQPYIESLKKKNHLQPIAPDLPVPPPTVRPPSVAPQDVDNPQTLQPYIERLREENRLGPAETKIIHRNADVPQPYIESIKAGRELEPAFRKTVQWAAGLSIVTSGQFNLKSEKVGANSFNDVYRPQDKYNPSFDLFGEWQFFRNRYAGSFGLVGHVTIMTAKGKGVFTRSGNASEDTEFRFLAFPFSAGLSYRLVQTRFVIPFIELAALGTPFIESRNDDRPDRKAISRGVSTTAGVEFSLDWIGRKDAWARYDSNGVLHTYIRLQMQYLRTLAGPVSFNYTGLYGGLMFEF